MADLHKKITQRIQSEVACVYRAEDFCDLANQDNIERTLFQLAELNVLSPIGEGFFGQSQS